MKITIHNSLKNLLLYSWLVFYFFVCSSKHFFLLGETAFLILIDSKGGSEREKVIMLRIEFDVTARVSFTITFLGEALFSFVLLFYLCLQMHLDHILNAQQANQSICCLSIFSLSPLSVLSHYLTH